MIAQLDKIYFQLGVFRTIRRFVAYILEGRPLMSKARWANPLISTVWRVGAWMQKGKTPLKPIFILGMGRSGTTFLGTVLSTHKEIAYLNEPKLVWHLCFDNDDLAGNFTQAPAKYRLTPTEAQLKNGDVKIRSMYAFWQRISLSPRIADKYPELLFRIPMLQHIFPDAKYLAIVRHGAAVASSVKHLNSKLGPDGHVDNENWWGKNDKKWHIICSELIPQHAELSVHIEKLRALSDDYARTAVEWILTMNEILTLEQKMNGAIHVIKYENFIGNPDVILPKIMDFCELGTDPVMIPFIKKSVSSYKEKAYPEVVLPDFLTPIFNDMLKKLGYH